MTLLFCIYDYYCCCTVCSALLCSYSAIFIAASVRNKLIHSFSRTFQVLEFSRKKIQDFPRGVHGNPGLRSVSKEDRRPWRVVYDKSAANRTDGVGAVKKSHGSQHSVGGGGISHSLSRRAASTVANCRPRRPIIRRNQPEL